MAGITDDWKRDSLCLVTARTTQYVFARSVRVQRLCQAVYPCHSVTRRSLSRTVCSRVHERHCDARARAGGTTPEHGGDERWGAGATGDPACGGPPGVTAPRG